MSQTHNEQSRKVRTISQLEAKLSQDLAMCQTDLERSMCKAIGGKEIRLEAERISSDRALTSGEIDIASKYGYRASEDRKVINNGKMTESHVIAVKNDVAPAWLVASVDLSGKSPEITYTIDEATLYSEESANRTIFDLMHRWPKEKFRVESADRKVVEISSDQKRRVIEAAGYTICNHGVGGMLEGWYALLPGETEFFDNADECEADPSVSHRQNYLGFFSSEADLIEDVYGEVEVEHGVGAATLFWRELSDSVESLTELADQQGPRTLADLMYLQNAILSGGFIDHYPGESNVLEVVKELPSADCWLQFVKLEELENDTTSPTI